MYSNMMFTQLVILVVVMLINQSSCMFQTKTIKANDRIVGITGSSGLVGTELIKRLQKNGINIVKIKVNENSITSSSSLEGLEAIIHLAGENVASGDEKDGLLRILGRWTDNKKKKILDSRVNGTRALIQEISKLKKKPKTFISASAVGYYGFNNEDTVFDDMTNFKKGDGFLADVTEKWEAEAVKAKALKLRTATMRFAVILSKNGGLISKLFPIFYLGIGGNIGTGKQPFSFVTLNDACRAIEFVLENKLIEGPINVSSPDPTTNGGFTEAFGKALTRPAIFPVPEFAARAIFSEMGNEMLLGGQKAISKKLSKFGFKFEDIDIKSALFNVVNKN